MCRRLSAEHAHRDYNLEKIPYHCVVLVEEVQLLKKKRTANADGLDLAVAYRELSDGYQDF